MRTRKAYTSPGPRPARGGVHRGLVPPPGAAVVVLAPGSDVARPRLRGPGRLAGLRSRWPRRHVRAREHHGPIARKGGGAVLSAGAGTGRGGGHVRFRSGGAGRDDGGLRRRSRVGAVAAVGISGRGAAITARCCCTVVAIICPARASVVAWCISSMARGPADHLGRTCSCRRVLGRTPPSRPARCIVTVCEHGCSLRMRWT